jgi:hypothetical protein
MRRLALVLILAASLCVGATRCPDPRLRQAVIRGDTIAGSVVRRNKPLMFATVRLYSSSGKTAWVGKTDKNGRFTINKVPQGEYRLDVSGSESTNVQLNPRRGDEGVGNKMPVWNLFLIDNACVVTGMEW